MPGSVLRKYIKLSVKSNSEAKPEVANSVRNIGALSDCIAKLLFDAAAGAVPDSGRLQLQCSASGAGWAFISGATVFASDETDAVAGDR